MNNFIFAIAFLSLMLIPFGTVNVFAETQTKSSSDNLLDVKIYLNNLVSGEETRLKIEFLDPLTDKIQVHIDYSVNIKNNGDLLFGPIPLTHTSTGSVSIPVILEDGKNEIIIDVEGILFMPIPKETITFDVMIGQQPPISEETSKKIPAWVKNNADWWANDLIDDGTFVTGIQFLIHERIISVSSVIPVEDSSSDGIPKWIKNNADWWSQGLISDDDFLKGIEYLIQNGIVSIDLQNVEKSLNIGGVDLAHASPILGSTNATVTIIEFGDYQCPKCQNWFLNTKPEIVANYLDTGKANLYFVDIAFLGNDSLPAAVATYCAEEQDMYWEFHDHLYSNQRRIDSGWANYSNLQTYADVLGLDKEKFAKCMDSGKYEQSVVFNLEEGINNGIQATPSFIVVGPDAQQERISGPQPYVIFEEMIESMLN